MQNAKESGELGAHLEVGDNPVSPIRDLDLPTMNGVPHVDVVSPVEPNDLPTIKLTDQESTKRISQTVAPTSRFGDYELLSEIARGGMGVVYKARQVSLNRIVAVKMILGGSLASSEDVRRFYVEAEAAARLDHAAIVPIFEIGEVEGKHFFSMGYVDSGTLADVLRNETISPIESARFMILIADGVHFAHEHGVIHRDLKPSNILITKGSGGGRGQVSSYAHLSSKHRKDDSTSPPTFSLNDCLPKISDFGLAKHRNQESQLTSTGQILGTPSYMPPEQADASGKEIGPSADIYSLGAILYCMLVGRPPFQSANPMETLIQVVSQDPVSVRMLNPSIPKDLETICMKCLQKQMTKRYSSARELADDLQRFVDGDSILARPVTGIERAVRWVRRNPLVTVVGFLFLSSLVAGIGVTTILARIAMYEKADAQRSEKIAVQERARAFESEDRAKLEKNQALKNFATANFALANAMSQTFRPREAIKLLEQIPNEYRQTEWELARREFIGSELSLQDQESSSSYVAVHPFLTQLVSINQDGQFRVWNYQDGTLVCELQLAFESNGSVIPMTYSSDGKTIIAPGNSLHELQLFNSTNLESIGKPFSLEYQVKSIGAQPNNTSVILGQADGTIKIWEPSQRKVTRSWKGHEKSCSYVAFSPNGALIASCDDHALKIWNAKSLELQHEFSTEGERIVATCWSSDSFLIATACQGGSSVVWELATGKEKARFFENSVPGSIAIDSYRNIVAVGYGNNSIQEYSMENGNRLGQRIGHSSFITFLALTPSANSLISASSNGDIRRWSTNIAGVSSDDKVAIDCERGLIAIATKEGSIRVVSTQSREMLWKKQVHQAEVSALIVDEKSGRLVSADRKGNVSIKNIESGEEVGQFNCESIPVVALAIDSAHDRLLVGLCEESSLRSRILILDSRSFAPIRALSCEGESLFSIATVNRNGMIASCFGDGCIELWEFDAATPESIQQHQQGIDNLAATCDGRFLIASDYESAMVWDIERREKVQELRGERSFFESLAISKDGGRLLSGDMEGNLKFWDLETGKEVWSLPPLGGPILGMKFSSDFQRLIVVAGNGAVKQFFYGQ